MSHSPDNLPQETLPPDQAVAKKTPDVESASVAVDFPQLSEDPLTASSESIAPSEEPADESSKSTWTPLHPSYLAMERRTSWILFWCLLGIMLPVNGVLFWLLGRSWVFLGCAMGTSVAAGGLLWLIQVYLPRSHRAAGWMLSDRGIEIRKGVWWQHLIVIPKSRIQHTDLQQGPVLRAYGLAKLAIFTAGTENAEIELEGLSLEAAQQVRDRLMEASRQPPQGV